MAGRRRVAGVGSIPAGFSFSRYTKYTGGERDKCSQIKVVSQR
jgi:hypothetical protein